MDFVSDTPPAWFAGSPRDWLNLLEPDYVFGNLIYVIADRLKYDKMHEILVSYMEEKE